MEVVKDGENGQNKKFSFLDVLQRVYDKLIDRCFAHPYITVGVGVLSVAIGVWMLGLLPQQLMPTAERNQFAVEIYLPTGSSMEKTMQIADSVKNVLKQDDVNRLFQWHVVAQVSCVLCTTVRWNKLCAVYR